eukprot:TRINITY_DN11081_c1_g1_i2.p1 TRINITY_DN11081_c1_g1~~TRINITY_DN11081_c1_g1_i2.p1  ORF type:complete len:102 (+),score=2.58 TRINITY_DN11081_c1_g1_i2:459-764(+)
MINQLLKFDHTIIFSILKRVNGLDHEIRAHKNIKLKTADCLIMTRKRPHYPSNSSQFFSSFSKPMMNQNLKFSFLVCFYFFCIFKRINGSNHENSGLFHKY